MTGIKKLVAFSLVVFQAIAGLTASAGGGWPARVFAPYMYIGRGDGFKLTDCDDACGVKYYTLAFIIARQQGTGKATRYLKEPAWDGRFPMEQDVYQEQIQAIRRRGGDVIMSFGGEAGRELANVIDDPAELEAAYQGIIDRYQFTWLDFDIEGDNLDHGKLDSERRNAALAGLQKKNPGLVVSYTLPINPDGLSRESRELLIDARTKGVKVHSVDIMVMFFGRRFINHGKSEGQLGIESALKAREQLQEIDPGVEVGLCPCLGRNGSRDEVFTLDDAKTLMAFAVKTPWVGSLHYWSINDDAAPRGRRRASAAAANSAGVTTDAAAASLQPFDFANVFKSFTTR
jgi:hypothetical protein